MFKIVQDDHNGHIKLFPDSRDNLGEVQPQRHPGVGQEQGLPQGVNFWKNCINIGCSLLFRMIMMAISICPDSQDHLGKVQPQRHQGVGQEQGLPQGVIFWKNCINHA